MSGAGAEIIVLDTEVSRARSSIFEVDRVYDEESVVDHGLVLIPSRLALTEVAAQFDYETVALPHDFSDYLGLKDYRNQRRLAFICSRECRCRSCRRSGGRSLLVAERLARGARQQRPASGFEKISSLP